MESETTSQRFSACRLHAAATTGQTRYRERDDSYKSPPNATNPSFTQRVPRKKKKDSMGEGKRKTDEKCCKTEQEKKMKRLHPYDTPVHTKHLHLTTEHGLLLGLSGSLPCLPAWQPACSRLIKNNPQAIGACCSRLFIAVMALRLVLRLGVMGVVKGTVESCGCSGGVLLYWMGCAWDTIGR